MPEQPVQGNGASGADKNPSRPPEATAPSVTGASADVTARPAVFRASVYPKGPLPTKLSAPLRRLEKELGMPVFLLLQDGGKGLYDYVHPYLFEALHSRIVKLPKTPIALVIDSPGGSAKAAYQLATALRRHCGGFTAFVPRMAKSAATLLTLGAQRILLGCCAELGPIDAQFDDPEREDHLSALDEVQSLDRLHAFAMDAFDRTMFLLAPRTGKKIETLIAPTFDFVAKMMRPLLENIDVVHYTQTSRVLRVAEEYAVRLLQPTYASEAAEKIAHRLVEVYPEHEFVIDNEEASRLGLRTEEIRGEVATIAEELLPSLGRVSIIGMMQEVKDANQEADAGEDAD